MPNSFGKLTDQERKQVLDWMEARKVEMAPCHSCHGDHVELDNYVVDVPARVDPQRLGYALILVAVVCQGCALTRFFDARLMGIVPTYAIR